MCLDPHLNEGWGWCLGVSLSPPLKYLTDRSRAVLLLWIFFFLVFSVLCLMCLCACLFVCALWSPAWGRGGGGGLASWLSFVESNCEFVTFPLVSWVRCGTCLYRLLIFAPLLILFSSENIIKINYQRQSSGQVQEYIMMWHQSEDVPTVCHQQPPFPSYCYTWHGDSL